MSPFKPIIHSVMVPSRLSREVRRSTHGSLRWSQYNEQGVLTETGIEQEQDSETKIWKTHALRSGDLGFKVGDWFVCPKGAHDCGIIHLAKRVHRGITHDSEMAYAILISEDEEIDLHNPMIDPYTNETVRPILIEGMPTLSARASAALRDDPTIIRYKAHQKDTGRFKLMRNMSLRYPIRVLRSWDSLGSGNLRPRGGVRYEGLYHVSAHGTKLIPSSESPDGRDHWHYTFDLKREPDQPSFSNALRRPTKVEMEAWESYMQESEDYDEGVRVFAYEVGSESVMMESGISYDRQAEAESDRERGLEIHGRKKESQEEESFTEKMSAWGFGRGYSTVRGKIGSRKRGFTLDGSGEGSENEGEDEDLGPLG